MNQEASSFIAAGTLIEPVNCELREPVNGALVTPVTFFKRINSHLRRFTIPIYSGIIGVLIPEKKLIPLNLMPLELEFTMNPYALYCL